MDGVVVIDKPEGYTSFDVVAKVRKIFGERKVGHTGTLDPLATGVLVVLLGKAAKAQVFMENSFKEYLAGFKLGVRTDTQDITGTVIKETDVKVSREDVEKAALSFTGDIKQIPPMYSALKRNGVKLYDMARRGVEVEREARDITIHNIELLDYDETTKEGKLKVKCSKGTYIRTLCADIGDKLKCGGIMTSLRRNYTDGFGIEESKSLDELFELSERNELEKALLNTDVLFKNLQKIDITPSQKTRFLNGGSLMTSRINVRKCENGKTKVHSEGSFLGLGEIDLEKGEMSVLKILSGGN